MKYSVKYEEYCERRGEAVTLSDLDDEGRAAALA